MQQKLNISFFLRESKKNKHGLSPIYTILSVNKSRRTLATGIYIEAKDWIPQGQIVNPSSKFGKAHNNRLTTIKNDFLTIFNQFYGREININDIVNRYRGTDVVQQKNYSVMEAMSALVQQKEKEKQAGKLDNSTYRKYNSSKNHLQEFIKSIGATDIALKDLMPHFIKDFELYLGSKSDSPEWINKTIQHFQSSISYAIDHGWMSRNPFSSYKYLSVPRKIEYLLIEEFKDLEEATIKNQSLSMVRDLFVFACYTGLSYIDLMDFNYDQIMTNNEGDPYILMKTRRKNSKRATQPFIIPLNRKALAIIEKYRNVPKDDEDLCLPRISNPVFNRQLKKLGTLVGIERVKLTVKLARSTAGTLLLNQGVPLSTVSHILGHSNVKQTQMRYSELLQETIFEDLKKAQLL